MIERFSRAEFEKVLEEFVSSSDAVRWESRDLVMGEYRYSVVIKEVGDGNAIIVEIASSVGLSGYADDVGENSIRVWLTDLAGMPLGNKIQRWVTRVSGWDRRLTDVLTKLVEIAGYIHFCNSCNSMRKVFIVKKEGNNKGRFFVKCNCPNSFAWLDEFEQTGPDPVVEGNSIPSCPLCGAKMVRRDGKFGKFFGCSIYPACRGTMSIKKAEKEVVATTDKSEKPSKPTPSSYQLAVFDHIQNKPTVNLVVEAVAGSGKTWTVVEALKLFPAGSKIIYLAFNRHIVKELISRVPKTARIGTYHSVGLKAVKTAFGKDVEVEKDKIYMILDSAYPKDMYGHLWSLIKKVVDLMKANLYEPDDTNNFDYLVDRYGIELNGDRDLVFQAVQYVMKRSFEMTNVVDYEDMIWFPVVHNLSVDKYDCVLIDEAQDSNRCQIELAKMMVKDTGKIVAVGDRYQSLYGFRGADVEAIPNLISELNADTLPLSITYRCPKAAVEEVNSRFSHIAFEASEWAIQGSVEYISDNRAMSMYADGDMVLCRTNAPLVRPVFTLIRNGIKATIRGQDIGKGLTVLIDKMKADDIVSLIKKLEEYKEKEVAKLLNAQKNNQAASVKDKVETIIAISDGCYDIRQVVDKIELVFSEDTDGVVFSSVHRAKGLESGRVFILHPELMPHPMAQKDWELEQENNIEYVAITRTLDRLYFVN